MCGVGESPVVRLSKVYIKPNCLLQFDKRKTYFIAYGIDKFLLCNNIVKLNSPHILLRTIAKFSFFYLCNNIVTARYSCFSIVAVGKH